jgi:hypothetical protein
MVIDTMKRISIKTFISIGLALAGIMLVTNTAHAQCEAFPKVPWWGTLNHEKVASFVSRKHEGNWKPYLKKWA